MFLTEGKFLEGMEDVLVLFPGDRESGGVNGEGYTI